MTVLKYFSIEALLQNYTENLLQYNIIVQKGISYESMNNLCYKTNKKAYTDCLLSFTEKNQNTEGMNL